ncbi:hypothetical protein [Vibrio phage VP41s3]|nr:hypothetical protein [Vibrio phage VP41s3]
MRNHNEKRLTNQRRRASIETKLRRRANAEYKRKLEKEALAYEREA